MFTGCAVFRPTPAPEPPPTATLLQGLATLDLAVRSTGQTCTTYARSLPQAQGLDAASYCTNVLGPAFSGVTAAYTTPSLTPCTAKAAQLGLATMAGYFGRRGVTAPAALSQGQRAANQLAPFAPASCDPLRPTDTVTVEETGTPVCLPFDRTPGIHGVRPCRQP